jgi:hypothetical protein
VPPSSTEYRSSDAAMTRAMFNGFGALREAGRHVVKLVVRRSAILQARFLRCAELQLYPAASNTRSIISCVPLANSSVAG